MVSSALRDCISTKYCWKAAFSSSKKLPSAVEE